jgi:hypothetical protein
MTTKPPLQKILQGIQHTENESKQNPEKTVSTKPQEKKRQGIRVTLITCTQSNPLNNKNN